MKFPKPTTKEDRKKEGEKPTVVLAFKFHSQKACKGYYCCC